MRSSCRSNGAGSCNIWRSRWIEFRIIHEPYFSCHNFSNTLTENSASFHNARRSADTAQRRMSDDRHWFIYDVGALRLLLSHLFLDSITCSDFLLHSTLACPVHICPSEGSGL